MFGDNLEENAEKYWYAVQHSIVLYCDYCRIKSDFDFTAHNPTVGNWLPFYNGTALYVAIHDNYDRLVSFYMTSRLPIYCIALCKNIHQMSGLLLGS